MNPAFDRTLSLLVEIKTDHSTPDFDGSRDRERKVQFGDRERKVRAGNNNVAQRILGKAKSSYSISSDDPPASRYIPPPLKKAETFFDRLKAALINSKEKFKAGVRKVSAKIRKRKDSN